MEFLTLFPLVLSLESVPSIIGAVLGLGLVIVGLVPLAGCLALLLFWPRPHPNAATPEPA